MEQRFGEGLSLVHSQGSLQGAALLEITFFLNFCSCTRSTTVALKEVVTISTLKKNSKFATFSIVTNISMTSQAKTCSEQPLAKARYPRTFQHHIPPSPMSEIQTW